MEVFQELALSIPPWFDCGTKVRSVGRATPQAFNPTLVRLRRGQRKRPGLSGGLSIPPWFDCGTWCAWRVLAVRDLSIPPWFDCGLPPARGTLQVCCPLSIPPWFDCGTPCRWATRLTLPCFQSHLGSIAAVLPTGVFDRVPPAFNPTLVRLRLPFSEARERAEADFQSHLGSIAAPWGGWCSTRGSAGGFQSHLGSIAARWKSSSAMSVVRGFQSHLGSIAAIP